MMDSQAKKAAVVAFLLKKKSTGEIVKELSHLKVNRFFVYLTIKHYNETGSTKRKIGRCGKVTAITPENNKKVRDHLRRNPRRSAIQSAKSIVRKDANAIDK